MNRERYQRYIKLRKEFHVDDEMVGTSQKIIEIREIIETAGKTNARVFITGDSDDVRFRPETFLRPAVFEYMRPDW